MQVVAGVAENIDEFRLRYVQRSLHAHAKLLALMSMKATNAEAYRLFAHRESHERQSQCKVLLTIGLWLSIAELAKCFVKCQKGKCPHYKES